MEDEQFERLLRRAKRQRAEVERALAMRKAQVKHRESYERESRGHNRHTNWDLVLMKNDTIPTWQGSLK